MYASRMSNLPPYLFARIDEMKAEQRKKGADIIDLGVGDPDLATPPHIVEALCKAAKTQRTTTTRRMPVCRVPERCCRLV